MVSKANMAVSFAALASAWMVGFAVARLLGWRFLALQVNLSAPFELLWIGFAAATFCMLFFGRLGFVVFLALGMMQAQTVFGTGIFTVFFQVLSLSWFGMVGTIAGEKLFLDLKEKKEFDALEKPLLALFGIGIVFALLIGAFSGALDGIGKGVFETLQKIRSGEWSLDNILDFFKPVETGSNAGRSQVPNQR